MTKRYMIHCACCGRRGRHAGRGLRVTCYNRYAKRETLGAWPLASKPADHVLEIWRRYTRQDWTKRQIAEELGMSMGALSQALTRARRRKDERAIIRDIPNFPRLPGRRRRRAK